MPYTDSPPAAFGERASDGDEFGPMASASPVPRPRASSGELAEVAIDGASSSDGAATKPGKPGGLAAAGRRPSIQLTAQAGGGRGAAQVPALAPPPAGPAGRARVDSGGLDYAPDSKAVMARINRWWKNFDEGYMQPKFGGPARSPGTSSANLAALAGGAAGASGSGGAVAGSSGSPRGVQGSSKSFTVPAARLG